MIKFVRFLNDLSKIFLITIIGSLGLAAQTVITQTTRLESQLKPGEAHQYALQLARGESAEIIVKQQGVDVVVEIKSSTGELLDLIDSPTGRSGDEVIEIFAKESETYTLVVRPFDKNEPPGSFKLETRALRGASETAQLFKTRKDSRDAATQWLRPRSADIPRSGVIPSNFRIPQLDEVARRARVIGLGEATHGSREFNDLRFSLTRYLIERHGYRIITIEASSGTLELLTAYVNGRVERTPEITRLMQSEIWIGKRTRGELYEWAREWNRKHPRDRVRIIGVDPQGSSDPRETLTSFIGKAYGENLLKRWTPVEKQLADADEQTFVFGDSGVDAAARQLLVEIVAGLKRDEPILNARFGNTSVKRAMEAAQTLTEFADFNSGSDSAISHSRDWYMAARVLRTLEEDPSSKAVYWAHNAHVVHPTGSSRTTGALLRQTLGCDYAALAVTFGEGAFVAQVPNDPENRLGASALPPSADESIESVLLPIRSEGTLATWPCVSSTNLSEPEWLKKAHPMHWVGGLYDPKSVSSSAYRNFDLLRDFDGVIFLPRVTAEEIPKDRPSVPPRKR